jgi:hypothetical protein
MALHWFTRHLPCRKKNTGPIKKSINNPSPGSGNLLASWEPVSTESQNQSPPLLLGRIGRLDSENKKVLPYSNAILTYAASKCGELSLTFSWMCCIKSTLMQP